MNNLWFVVFALLLLGIDPAIAQTNEPNAPSKELDIRAKQIGKQLRCVVCQNQSIDDSDAPLAADMRKLVRNRLAKGESDAEVIAYITERYGNFVLLKPPLKRNTWGLWFGPALFLSIGAGIFYLTSRVKKPVAKSSQVTENLEQTLNKYRD